MEGVQGQTLRILTHSTSPERFAQGHSSRPLPSFTNAGGQHAVMQQDHDDTPFRSSTESPQSRGGERVAQQKYRAKTLRLFEELQRLVKPRDKSLSSASRRQHLPMSKASVLELAVETVRKIVLDDEALGIARRRHTSCGRNGERSSVPSTNFAIPWSQVITMAKEDTKETSPSTSTQTQPTVQATAAVMDYNTASSSKHPEAPANARSAWEQIDAHYFLQNWVGAVPSFFTAENEEETDAMDVNDGWSLVKELDSAEAIGSLGSRKNL